MFDFTDPRAWTVEHIQQWLDWATHEYQLLDIDLSKFLHIDGRALCRMSREELARLVNTQNAEVLFYHLDILRQCNCVSCLLLIYVFC